MAASQVTRVDVLSSGHADVDIAMSAEESWPAHTSKVPADVDRAGHCLQLVHERMQQALEQHSRSDHEDMEPDFLGENTDLTADLEASLFVRTPAMGEAYSTLQETGMVILCGPPGCGKTTLARALLRRSRQEGFRGYALQKLDDWNTHIGDRHTVVALDGTLGKVRVDSQQHASWEQIEDNAMARIKQGTLRLVITVYPHVLCELQWLEEKWKGDAHVVWLTAPLPEDVKERLLNFHLNKLELETGEQLETHEQHETGEQREVDIQQCDTEKHRQTVQKILQKDVSGPVFPWCCDYLAKHRNTSEDPTTVFTMPAEAYIKLFRKMVGHQTYGRSFAAVFALSMRGVFHFLHNVSEAKPHLEEIGLDLFPDDQLAEYAKLLQGSVLSEGQFSSRVLYEAAGLALGCCFRLPILLKVCDFTFLVCYVNLTRRPVVPFNICVTVGSVPSCSRDAAECAKDCQALVERIFTDLLHGNPQRFFQQPCLQSPQFLQELDNYCARKRREMKKLLKAVDPVHKLSLVYWSALHPSHHLTRWCLSKMKAHKKLSAKVLMACSLFDNLTHNSECQLLSVLHDLITPDHFRYLECIIDFPVLGKDQCLSEEMQKQIQTITERGSVQRTLQYLCDPSLPIPPDLVEVWMTQENKLCLKVNDRRHWYLVFRLLTDRTVNETDSDGNTVLHIAVDRGQTAAIRLSHKAGAVLTQQNKKGQTPDQLVCRTEALALWSRKACDGIDDKDGEGRTGLMVACHEGQEDFARLYIQLGADVRITEGSATGCGLTALHFACLCTSHKASVNITRLLVQAGADVNTHDKVSEVTPLMNEGGNTPLSLAARSGHSDTAELLIRHGADVNTLNDVGDTPLMYAAMNGQSDTAELLIRLCADVNTVNDHGDTPLLSAARNGHSDTSDVLIHHGADVTTLNDWGDSPVMSAAWNGHSETVEVLIHHGADVNTLNDRGDTPVMSAARNGHSDTVEVLIRHGADINIKCKMGDTPLFSATSCGHSDTAELLIRHGADVNTLNEWNDTPLLTAARNGHSDTAKLLIRHGADVNMLNGWDDTPLLTAARNGHSDTAEVLICHGADVNLKCKMGDSPLLSAARNGHTDTAKMLICHGADVNTPNDRGFTPLLSAIRNGHSHTANMLRQYVDASNLDEA
ncbi:uncharacterized protein LOC143275977 [Babylonia areolata]|uniref:uncharacterized protein LOC143275977 n=1 Tax=Babylonia areolata TaxID=304850 RepID=UPI003FCF6A92